MNFTPHISFTDIIIFILIFITFCYTIIGEIMGYHDAVDDIKYLKHKINYALDRIAYLEKKRPAPKKDEAGIIRHDPFDINIQ